MSSTNEETVFRVPCPCLTQSVVRVFRIRVLLLLQRFVARWCPVHVSTSSFSCFEFPFLHVPLPCAFESPVPCAVSLLSGDPCCVFEGRPSSNTQYLRLVMPGALGGPRFDPLALASEPNRVSILGQWYPGTCQPLACKDTASETRKLPCKQDVNSQQKTHLQWRGNVYPLVDSPTASNPKSVHEVLTRGCGCLKKE